MINKIYEGPKKERYFQKSRVFLYPVLEVKKKGGVITPINTYVSWDNNILRKERKLICTFQLGSNDSYRKFEKNILLRNELFCDFKEGQNGTGIYIFDFNPYAVDFDIFIKGAYSRLKPLVKEKVMNHYNGNNANTVYVDSFLNPKKYYEIYSRILGIPESTLRGGELCDKPDFIKEKLKMSIKKFDITDNSVNLQPTQKPTQ